MHYLTGFYMNWEEIWERGVYLSEINPLKKDNEYSVIKNKYPDRTAENTDIYSEKWVNSVRAALMGKSPSSAFEYWREQGWLRIAIPELDKFWGRIQPEKYHPEIDVGIHAMMVIDRSAYHNLSIESRLACLFHDFGKSLTPIGETSHLNHEKNGIPLIEPYLSAWNLNEEEKQVILFVGLWHGDFHTFENRNPSGALKFINNTDMLNFSAKKLDSIFKSVLCDDQGRKGLFNSKPRGIILVAETLKAIKNLHKVIHEKAESELTKREEKSISKGGEPYDDEKRNRLIIDVCHSLRLKTVSDLFTQFKNDIGDNNENTIIKHKKNTI